MVAYSAKANPQQLINPSNGKHSFIVQIEHQKTFNTCSAFVVDNKTAVTAAHCLLEPKPKANPPVLTYQDWWDSLKDNEYLIYNSKGEKTFVKAVATHVHTHADIAVIEGDFTDFNKAQIDVDSFNEKDIDEVYVCGYAGGFPTPTCNSGDFKGTSTWSGLSNAYIAKGMSGGPVLNKNYKVIGVNSHRTKAGLSTFGILFGIIKVEKK